MSLFDWFRRKPDPKPERRKATPSRPESTDYGDAGFLTLQQMMLHSAPSDSPPDCGPHQGAQDTPCAEPAYDPPSYDAGGYDSGTSDSGGCSGGVD